MATLYKKSIFYYLDYHLNNKRIRKSVGTDKKLANLALANITIKLDRIKAGVDRYETIENPIDIFYEKVISYLSTRKAKRTVETYQLRLDNFLKWLNSNRSYTYINEVQSNDIENFMTDRLKQVSPRTVNNELMQISIVFNIAVKLKLMNVNPAKGITYIATIKRPPYFYPEDDLKKMFHLFTPRYKPFFTILLYTGIRKGELEHTEWISKGKAGVPQELGIRVCVLEDQYGFVLHHDIMEKKTDDKIAVSMTKTAKKKYSNLDSCSYDTGFYTPENKIELNKLLDFTVLPKKGKLSKQDKELEYSEEFIEKRRQHPAVESGINALENHGLDRCPDHGIDGFKRYVALAVLARNLQKLGHLVQQKELQRYKRQEKSRLAV